MIKSGFEPLGKEYGVAIHFVESRLNWETAILAKGSEGVCIFVNDTADKRRLTHYMCSGG